MMSSIRLRLAALAAIAMAFGCSPQPAAKTASATGLDATFQRDELVIVTSDGSRHEFDIYLATDFEQQQRGLMFVRSLPERTGMLFVYDNADIHSMWMKNTYISLDIVFARGDGTVSSVIHNTEPLSLQSLSSIEPVNYVLELNAGVARRYNITTGSRLVWAGNQSTAAIESAR